MKPNSIFLLFASLVLLGCATISGLFPTETPAPTHTPLPTNTPRPTATPTPAPTATATPQPDPEPLPEILDERQVVEDLSYSFLVPQGYDFGTSGPRVTISDAEFNVIISLITIPNQDSQTLEEMMEGFLDGVGNDPDIEDFETGNFFETRIDGLDALGSDVSGKLFGDQFAGQVVLTVTKDDLIFVGFGLAVNQLEAQDRWESEAKAAFTTVIDSIDFDLEEPQTGSCTISDDESYGYSEDNPIRVGGDSFEGPPRERAFLDNLLGPNGESTSYERVGSFSHGDTILDDYEISIQGGETVHLYIDQYDYSDPFAPVGFTCVGAFPFSAP